MKLNFCIFSPKEDKTSQKCFTYADDIIVYASGFVPYFVQDWKINIKNLKININNF